MAGVLKIRGDDGLFHEIAAIRGEDGDDGVYTGSQTPPTNAKVWIDPTASDSDYILESLGAAPLVHSHGNITSEGKVGSTANLPLFTGSTGLVEAKTPASALLFLGAQSNKNLLDNWDFRSASIVNQRAASSYSNASNAIYTIDRWALFHDSNVAISLNVQSGGIQLAKTSGNWGAIIQPLDPIVSAGKVLTLSVEIDGVIYTSTFTTTSGQIYGDVNSSIKWYCGPTVGGFGFGVGIFLYTNTPIIISRIKLEYGSISTLANDPLANYHEQLRKCQPYQYVLYSGGVNGNFGTGIAYDTTHCYMPVPLPTTLRNLIVPSVSVLEGTFVLSNTSGVDKTISLIQSVATHANDTSLHITASGLTAGSAYYLKNSSTAGKLLFDVNL